MPELLLDRAGRRRSPATMPGFHIGRPPRNKGLRYPADPPSVEEIVAVMRAAGDGVITSIYLHGIDNAEIIEAVHARRAPVIQVSASLRL
jgi:hypothetical protein